jgi:peptide deformylase
MILPIVQYGHPVLRKKGSKIPAITDSVRKLAQHMLDTMYKAHGVGLAAQQIGQALQLTVIDVRESDRPSQLFLGVREVPIESSMPMVLINPEITKSEGQEIGIEGCLSFPEITADINRASTIHVKATQLDGQVIQFTALGLLSRAIQHELDHLNGVLFIDRMDPESRKPLEEGLEKMKSETIAQLKKEKKIK